MKTYTVVLKVNLPAESPLEAAKKLEEWSKGTHWQYEVTDDETKIEYSVDLEEDDEDAVLEITKP